MPSVDPQAGDTVSYAMQAPEAPLRVPARFVSHPSFELPEAESVYGRPPPAECAYLRTYMPEEVTAQSARCMHYAASRAHRAEHPAERERWRRAYYGWRDQVVLGNFKLIHKAIRMWTPPASLAEDMVGDC